MFGCCRWRSLRLWAIIPASNCKEFCQGSFLTEKVSLFFSTLNWVSLLFDYFDTTFNFGDHILDGALIAGVWVVKQHLACLLNQIFSAGDYCAFLVS